MPQPKKPKSRRVRKPAVSHMRKQTFTVLQREVERLMDLSFNDKLEPNNSKALIEYIKLLNELKELEDMELEAKKLEKRSENV